MTFRNVSNNHTVTVRHSFIWCLIFGVLYFAKHDAWAQAVIALLFVVVTGGVAWLIYPFFAKRIVRQSYLRRGWVEVG